MNPDEPSSPAYKRLQDRITVQEYESATLRQELQAFRDEAHRMRIDNLLLTKKLQETEESIKHLNSSMTRAVEAMKMTVSGSKKESSEEANARSCAQINRRRFYGAIAAHVTTLVTMSFTTCWALLTWKLPELDHELIQSTREKVAHAHSRERENLRRIEKEDRRAWLDTLKPAEVTKSSTPQELGTVSIKLAAEYIYRKWINSKLLSCNGVDLPLPNDMRSEDIVSELFSSVPISHRLYLQRWLCDMISLESTKLVDAIYAKVSMLPMDARFFPKVLSPSSLDELTVSFQQDSETESNAKKRKRDSNCEDSDEEFGPKD